MAPSKTDRSHLPSEMLDKRPLSKSPTLTSTKSSSTSRTRHHANLNSSSKVSPAFYSRIKISTSTRNTRKRASTSKPTPTSMRLIRVLINNRLGSRETIFCSSSDTIYDFKKLAAMKIGTKPEPIMLKRQGQRPLKNNLTLEDYEIGNGSWLDLELDTAD